MIPSDPVMFLSYINTKLRDDFDSLDDFCCANDLDIEMVKEKLSQIGYQYNKSTNQFV